MGLAAPPIVGKTVASAGYKARDVRADIKELGFEKGVERALTLMADEQVGVRQSLGEIASILDQLINRMHETVLVNEQLVKQIDALRSRDKTHNATQLKGG